MKMNGLTLFPNVIPTNMNIGKEFYALINTEYTWAELIDGDVSHASKFCACVMTNTWGES